MLKYIGCAICLLLIGGVQAQPPVQVKGSGYVLTQQRETGYFNSIEVAQQISVFIVQGELQPITVEADNNLFPYIKTVVRNGTLKIYIADTVNIVKFADLNVLISMPSIATLYARQQSFIDASPQVWNVKNVVLDASSGSRIKLAAKAVNIQVNAKTSATIELKGHTEVLNAELKTAARLFAHDLDADKAELELATGAKAEVKVNAEIEYDLCGNARLVYKGNPKVTKSAVASGGWVTNEK